MNPVNQRSLFSSTPVEPEGLVYMPKFLTVEEERRLLDRIETLPLEEARYREFTAKRRVVSYGGTYDFTHHELLPAAAIPDFLDPLRERIGAWTGIVPAGFEHALIAEYRAGTQLGWHRDVPDFEVIVGFR